MPRDSEFFIFSSTDIFEEDFSKLDKESNCACPSGVFGLKRENVDVIDSIIYRRTDICEDNIEGFHTAFNPLGETGIILLNERAWKLLNAFNTPSSLDEVLIAYKNSQNVVSAVYRLIELNLIESLDCAYRFERNQPESLNAWLHITNECNLTCVYCFIEKTSEQMDLETGKKVVDAIFRSAVINNFKEIKLKYSGGEATLNFPLVIALHEYASVLARKMRISLDGVMLSNGVSLSESMIQKLKHNKIRLMISLDGINEHNDTQRFFNGGRGSFSYVERTLDRLEKHGLLPYISITLTNKNLNGLPQIIRYVLRRKLPFILNFYRENECASSIFELVYQDEDLIDALNAAFKVIEKNLPPYSLMNMLVDRSSLSVMHERPCGLGDSYMVIDQFGRVAKCHLHIKSTISDVSVEDPLQEIRADKLGIQNPPVDQKEGCKDCQWRYWCAGGCPAQTYWAKGKYDVKSPNCHIYKSVFPEVLRLEALRLLKYQQYN